MKIKKSQSYIDLTIRNWDNMDFGSALIEMCESVKRYDNDMVEVHQVVNLGKRKGEWHYLIILNISKDLDDLGETMNNNYR